MTPAAARPIAGLPPAPRLPRRLLDAARLLIVLALLMTVFGLVTERFLSLRTFQIVANQIPALLIVAVGMTFVLVAGGIDLTVGSLLALAGGVLGLTLQAGLPLPVAIAACLATGLVVGGVNGVLITRWRLPSFIVTLGMLEAARGGAYLVTGSQTQYIGPRVEVLGEVALFGLSLPFLLALVVVGLAHLVLTRAVFGRYVVAVGTNEEAVRLAGVNGARVKLAVFATSGGLAALAAVIHTARLGAADPNAGVGFELQAIAAVVVGGTSLLGGRGTIWGTLLGVLIIAVLDTGLAQVGVAEPIKRLVTGTVIVLAVITDNVRQRPR